MPKTGETIYFYFNDGRWQITDDPNYWRKQSYFVMECYVTTATDKWEAY